jgi:hypothetical protein
MSSSIFGHRSNNWTRNIWWGVGGAIIGAGVTYLITSPARDVVTGFVKGLFARHDPSTPYGTEDPLENMENEGGVSHVVRPPSTSLDSKT